MRTYRTAYPLSWRLLDALEAVAARVWPARLAAALPYLLPLPVILCTAFLVVGLAEIAENSLHVLDKSTFRLSESYTLANVDARVMTLPVLIYNSNRSIITPGLAAISVVSVLVAGLAIVALDCLVGLDIFLKSK